MTKKLTRIGAKNLTRELDRIATVIQNNPEVLGIDPRIAKDFALRADMISDEIEATALTNFPKSANESILGDTGSIDPADIGEDVGGPLEIVEPPREAWMTGHFSQEQYKELAAMQQSGAFSNAKAG